MTLLVRRPSPAGELQTLRQAMDRLFDDRFDGGWTADGSVWLPLDIRSTADAIEVDAALPGIAPEDVDVTVQDGTLTIKGESRADSASKEGDLVFSEIRRGSFSRAVSLPSGLEPDKATATFEHGLLHLRIPKAEAVKPRQIRITPTIDGQAATEAKQA